MPATPRSEGPSSQQRGWSVVRAGDEASAASINDMNASHDAAHARALHRLSQPIPRPAVDDTAPDLVLGVIDYKYSMRPAWRVAVAQALGVPPAAVKLHLRFSLF